MPAPTLLIDTNVLLACVRGGKLGTYVAKQYNLKDGSFDSLICVVTIGEIFALAQKLNWGAEKIATMERLLDNLVVININSTQVLRAYAKIDCFSDSNGTRMGKNDLWIAAVAHVTGATLLTTDMDFDHLSPSHLNRIWVDPSHGKTV